MAVATVQGIRSFNPIPAQGRRFLSLDISKADLFAVVSICRQLGFTLSMVQMQTRSGIQVHALLWEGAIEDTPDDMDTKIDELSEAIDPDAIRYATGAWTSV